MFAICNNCHHCIHDIQNEASPETWYNYSCGAKEIPMVRCTQTGNMIYEHGQKYEHCNSVNSIQKKGACVLYKPIKAIE